MIVTADICVDHTGKLERRAYLSDIRSFTDFDHRTYLITLGRDISSGTLSSEIYCSLSFHNSKSCRFFKSEHMKVQVSDDLYKVFERALMVYKSDIRDSKLIEIGII